MLAKLSAKYSYSFCSPYLDGYFKILAPYFLLKGVTKTVRPSTIRMASLNRLPFGGADGAYVGISDGFENPPKQGHND